MACVKLGSKSDAFQRQGQAWFCTTGLPSDVVVEVAEMSFHLHKNGRNNIEFGITMGINIHQESMQRKPSFKIF
ncbi:UNVERIFIED_CONTAM: BTB/POZ domain-containing protein [Sesamum angustifolium]|uniref:BTB/POZ domain-containing protein n=1 Tax=Sesamum angustifolium TaxID=2727405 RepID=A0AAW2PAE1_9LAMI